MTAYEMGQQARRDGKTFDDNPFNRKTDEASASAWNLGFRDENDAINGPPPQLSDFVRRRYRRGS